MKRQTTRSRRRTRASVLQVRVMSPRIAWFGILRFLTTAFKYACVLAVLAGAGWGVWSGVRRAFYENPDFRLQVIDLNPNPAIDEAGLVSAAGISLSANLFQLDMDEVTARLQALPELASARAERHLPGSLVVRVKAREPRAWVACPEADVPARREAGALLVDHDGFAFACPVPLLESAANLPIIMLPAREDSPVASGTKLRHPELRHCFTLLSAASKDGVEALGRIESIEQSKEWALTLTTREGTVATFGVGDHARQVTYLQSALDHAHREGYTISTINLIPKENVPVTVRDVAAPPRAIPVAEPSPEDLREERRSRDLETLLKRG